MENLSSINTIKSHVKLRILFILLLITIPTLSFPKNHKSKDLKIINKIINNHISYSKKIHSNNIVTFLEISVDAYSEDYKNGDYYVYISPISKYYYIIEEWNTKQENSYNNIFDENFNLIRVTNTIEKSGQIFLFIDSRTPFSEEVANQIIKYNLLIEQYEGRSYDWKYPVYYKIKNGRIKRINKYHFKL